MKIYPRQGGGTPENCGQRRKANKGEFFCQGKRFKRLLCTRPCSPWFSSLTAAAVFCILAHPKQCRPTKIQTPGGIYIYIPWTIRKRLAHAFVGYRFQIQEGDEASRCPRKGILSWGLCSGQDERSRRMRKMRMSAAVIFLSLILVAM